MELTKTAEALLEAGKRAGADSVTSEVSPFLQELATGHARWMATRGRGGHQGWDTRRGRFERIQAEFGLVLANEIVAYSSTLLVRAPAEACADNIWATFRDSPGHWELASQPHRLVGLEMARSRRGIYYACLIAVD